MPVRHPTARELEAGLAEVRQSPRDQGVLELVVVRPGEGERQILEDGELSLRDGLVGDSWRSRSSARTSDGSPHPDMQLNVMNARVAALLAGAKSRWPLAGDQLFIDLDLSADNVPPGTRLAIGTAVIELTDQPHTGCGQVRRAFRRGRDEARQLRAGSMSPAPRRERQGGAAGTHSGRRPDEKASPRWHARGGLTPVARARPHSGWPRPRRSTPSATPAEDICCTSRGTTPRADPPSSRRPGVAARREGPRRTETRPV